MHRDFEKFVRDTGLPETVYEARCNIDASDVCGGEGNTCAPEDAPSDWETVIDEFREQFGYDQFNVSELRRELAEAITKQEQRIPGPPKFSCLYCGEFFGVEGGQLEGEPICPNCEDDSEGDTR